MEKVKRKAVSIFFTWAADLFLSAGIVNPNTVPVVHAETTVYVTPTDSKYHAYKCGNGTYTPTTLSNALAMGLTPCSKCFGSGYVPNPEPAPAPEPEPAPEPTPAPKPMKINKTSIILVKGQTSKLKASNAAGKVSWSSSKKSIASVSGNGKVTAKKKGKAVITARAGADTKQCKVTVEEPKLNLKNISLDIKKTKNLKLSGCKHSVTWTSSNPSVAKVSKGKVTAKQAGFAKITAKVHGKKYTCKVQVKKPKIQKIVLTESSIRLEYEEEKEISFRTVPANAAGYYDFSVKSSDTSVAGVFYDDENTIVIRSSQKSGKAEISVSGGGKTAKCQVVVDKPAVRELTLGETSLTLKPGESRSIFFGAEPNDAPDYYEAVWKSGNTGVATVEEIYQGSRYATVKATGEGETDITLTLGNRTAACHVTVQPDVP